MKKNIVIISLCFVLLFAAFPVFATSAANTLLITSQALNTGVLPEGVMMTEYNGVMYAPAKTSSFPSTDLPLRCALYRTSSNRLLMVLAIFDNNTLTFSQGSNYTAVYYGSSLSNMSMSNRTAFSGAYSGSANDSDNNTVRCHYFGSSSAGFEVNAASNTGDFPVYSSLAEALQAIYDDSFAPVVSLPTDTALVCGNVVYIELDGSGTFSADLSVVHPESCRLAGSPAWLGANQGYFLTNSLPSSVTDLQQEMTIIPWQRSTSISLLGFTDKGVYNMSINTGNSSYLAIVNPAFFGGLNPNNYYQAANGTIQMRNLYGASRFITYGLQSKITAGSGNVLSVSVDSPNGYTDGVVTDPVYNGTTNLDANFGGYNEMPESQSLFDGLTDFANQVLNLLKAPVEHIGQLISAGSGFMQSVAGVFGWLPSDVSGFIVSALFVVVAIGVFKSFLG